MMRMIQKGGRIHSGSVGGGINLLGQCWPWWCSSSCLTSESHIVIVDTSAKNRMISGSGAGHWVNAEKKRSKERGRRKNLGRIVFLLFLKQRSTARFVLCCQWCGITWCTFCSGMTVFGKNTSITSFVVFNTLGSLDKSVLLDPCIYNKARRLLHTCWPRRKEDPGHIRERGTLHTDFRKLLHHFLVPI